MGKNFYHKHNEVAETNDEVAKKESMKVDVQTTLNDFFIQQKLDCFVQSFEAVDKLGPCVEMFSDVRLREYFKAYVCTYGDPMKIYHDKLGELGYHMHTSIVTMEPVMYVRRKYIE